MLTMFDFINARPKLGNGKLGLKNFLDYFTLRRLLGNKRYIRSPKKRPRRVWPIKGKVRPKKTSLSPLTITRSGKFATYRYILGIPRCQQYRIFYSLHSWRKILQWGMWSYYLFLWFLLIVLLLSTIEPVAKDPYNIIFVPSTTSRTSVNSNLRKNGKFVINFHWSETISRW